MAVQVVVDTFEELRAAHVECQLLQHGGALGVGDAVEVDVGVVEVVDRGDDRVRGGQLILRNAQLFSPEQKVAQASCHSVASAVASVEVNSAKDSLSHRSFHHLMVT